MRESWDCTGDNTAAVTAGVQHTARPISAQPRSWRRCSALAVAIAVDATLIRLVLVPALMRLFGQWNWWLPGQRDKFGPRSPVTPTEDGVRRAG